MNNESEKTICDNYWVFIGETTGGSVYMCEKCGATSKESGVIISGPVSAVDLDTLYCPYQGYTP